MLRRGIHHNDSTTQRHDEAISSQGGSRGKGRMDKHYAKPLFSSASSIVKNHNQRAMSNEPISMNNEQITNATPALLV